MASSEIIYDVAVIGGGIAGAGVARDASLRGLTVILFEKNTCGSGTSSKSSKLIHGGIRYLENAWDSLKKADFRSAWKDFHFVFTSLRESHILARIAPGLVRPLELIIPIYRNRRRNPWTIVAGVLFYSLLSRLTGGRNSARVLRGAFSVLKLLPRLKSDGLWGAVLLWDHQTDDLGLVQATVRSATRSGAKVLEHCPVHRYRLDSGRNLFEIEVENSGRKERHYARKLVNASGPWIDEVRTRNGENSGNFLVPVSGGHLTLEQFTDHSAILEASDNRIFFVINIGSRARVGTTERICHTPDTVRITEEEIDYLLGELNRYFPGLNFGREKILSMDAGIRPLARPKQSLVPHAISREHDLRTEGGVTHLLGVKLTDHRRASAQVVDQLVGELRGIHPGIRMKCPTDRTPL